MDSNFRSRFDLLSENQIRLDYSGDQIRENISNWMVIRKYAVC